MCGIAGLFLKNPALEPGLGTMLAAMLGVLSDRGPDSAGFAVYGAGRPDRVKLTLRADDPAALAPIIEGVARTVAEGLAAAPEAFIVSDDGLTLSERETSPA